MATNPHVLQVHKSFARCAQQPEFFETFHARLMQASPKIQQHFDGVSPMKQSLFIRTGLPTLILFATGSQAAGRRLDQLAQSHSRGALGVGPELYDVWLETLLDVVAQFDNEFDDELGKAWRETLRTGLQRFTNAYDGAAKSEIET